IDTFQVSKLGEIMYSPKPVCDSTSPRSVSTNSSISAKLPDASKLDEPVASRTTIGESSSSSNSELRISSSSSNSELRSGSSSSNSELRSSSSSSNINKVSDIHKISSSSNGTIIRLQFISNLS